MRISLTIQLDLDIVDEDVEKVRCSMSAPRHQPTLEHTLTHVAGLVIGQDLGDGLIELEHHEFKVLKAEEVEEHGNR